MISQVRTVCGLCEWCCLVSCLFFFQAEDGIRVVAVTGFQTCALPICPSRYRSTHSSHCSIAFDTARGTEIGRASCRERGEISVVAVSLKKKNKKTNNTRDVNQHAVPQASERTLASNAA